MNLFALDKILPLPLFTNLFITLKNVHMRKIQVKQCYSTLNRNIVISTIQCLKV